MGGGVVDERDVTLGVYRSAIRSVTRGWGVKFSGEKRYVTITWPLTHCIIIVGRNYCVVFKVVLRLRMTYLGHLREIAPTGMIN